MPFAKGLNFRELALQINKEVPSEIFALKYTALAHQMISYVQQLRENELTGIEKSIASSV
jgi:hypothetical protein